MNMKMKKPAKPYMKTVDEDTIDWKKAPYAYVYGITKKDIRNGYVEETNALTLCCDEEVGYRQYGADEECPCCGKTVIYSQEEKEKYMDEIRAEAEAEYEKAMAEYPALMDAYNKECQDFIEDFLTRHPEGFKTDEDIKNFAIDFVKELANETEDSRFKVLSFYDSYDKESLKTTKVKMEVYGNTDARYGVSVSKDGIEVDIKGEKHYSSYREDDYDIWYGVKEHYDFQAEGFIGKYFSDYDALEREERAVKVKTNQLHAERKSAVEEKDVVKYINISAELRHINGYEIDGACMTDILKNAMKEIHKTSHFAMFKDDDGQFHIEVPSSASHKSEDRTRGTLFSISLNIPLSGVSVSCLKALQECVSSDKAFYVNTTAEMMEKCRNNTFRADFCEIIDYIKEIKDKAYIPDIEDVDAAFAFPSGPLTERAFADFDLDEGAFAMSESGAYEEYGYDEDDDYTEDYNDADIREFIIQDAADNDSIVMTITLGEDGMPLMNIYAEEEIMGDIWDDGLISLTETEKNMIMDAFGPELIAFDNEKKKEEAARNAEELDEH